MKSNVYQNFRRLAVFHGAIAVFLGGQSFHSAPNFQASIVKIRVTHILTTMPYLLLSTNLFLYVSFLSEAKSCPLKCMLSIHYIISP